MDEKELKALLEDVAKKNGKAISEAVKTEVEAATAGLMKASELESKLEAAGISKKNIETLTKAVEDQGLEMRKFFEKPVSTKTVEEIIEEKSKEIAKLASGGQNVKIEVPTRKTAVARSSVQSSTMAMVLPGVGELPYMGTVLSGLFRHAPVSPSSNGVIRYYDQNSITRNAAATAEAATKPESAITWIERTLTLEKIADSIPVSKEAWKDVYFIQSELNRLLNVNLALLEDAQLWDGSGTTPDLRGIYTSAYAFDYVGDAITRANLFDLIAAVKVDITNNRQSKYMPQVAVINPADSFKLKVTKLTDGQYVTPTWGNTSVIDGIRVVESSQVTENTMLVGDFNYATVYDLEGITVEMGWVNDQFIKNAMTILAEKRMGLLHRTVDQYAFAKVTDIDAALASLTSGAT